MVRIADATAECWNDVVAVMGTRGDQSRCWCQWFRHDRPGFYATTTAQRRAALQVQVEAPPPPGVLVYDDAGAPSGWCAVGPRADYPRLATYRMASATANEDGLWSVTCFIVRVGQRRKGLAEVLLDGDRRPGAPARCPRRRGLPARPDRAGGFVRGVVPWTTVGIPRAGLPRGRRSRGAGSTGRSTDAVAVDQLGSFSDSVRASSCSSKLGVDGDARAAGTGVAAPPLAVAHRRQWLKSCPYH